MSNPTQGIDLEYLVSRCKSVNCLITHDPAAAHAMLSDLIGELQPSRAASPSPREPQARKPFYENTRCGHCDKPITEGYMVPAGIPHSEVMVCAECRDKAQEDTCAHNYRSDGCGRFYCSTCNKKMEKQADPQEGK